MAVFPGGSAYNMAQSIADGYIIPTELTFKSFKDPDLHTFLFEADDRKLFTEFASGSTATSLRELTNQSGKVTASLPGLGFSFLQLR